MTLPSAMAAEPVAHSPVYAIPESGSPRVPWSPKAKAAATSAIVPVLPLVGEVMFCSPLYRYSSKVKQRMYVNMKKCKNVAVGKGSVGDTNPRIRLNQYRRDNQRVVAEDVGQCDIDTGTSVLTRVPDMWAGR